MFGLQGKQVNDLFGYPAKEPDIVGVRGRKLAMLGLPSKNAVPEQMN